MARVYDGADGYRDIDGQRGTRIDQLQDRLESAIADLGQADDAWDTLTAAQRWVVVRLAVRVLAAVARLTLGRLT